MTHMNRNCVAIPLLALFAATVSLAVPQGGPPPELTNLIDMADAIVILRLDKHLSDFGSPTGYSTHQCHVYQTLKGDIPKGSTATFQLYDTKGDWTTPYAQGSTHLMFLGKRESADEQTEYRTLTTTGAQVLLPPLGHERSPKGDTVEEQVRNLVRGAIAFQAAEHEQRQRFLQDMLREKQQNAGKAADDQLLFTAEHEQRQRSLEDMLRAEETEGVKQQKAGNTVVDLRHFTAELVQRGAIEAGRVSFSLYVAPKRENLRFTAWCELRKEGQGFARIPLAQVESPEKDRPVRFVVQCLAVEFIKESVIHLSVNDAKSGKGVAGQHFALGSHTDAKTLPQTKREKDEEIK